MDLQLATIKVLEPHASELDERLPAKFDVQFNPTEYTRTKGAQFAEIGVYGLDSPILQFVRGQNEKLTLDLFFDTTDQGMNDNVTPVTTLTEKFYRLVKQQRATHAPPKIEFHWSEHLKFVAVVESITQKFTLFSPEGIPLRATLSVTFREYRTVDEMVKELESADHSKVWVVKRGEQLSRIAAIAYGDPRLWRIIAERNGIDDPRAVAPGTLLVIPPLDGDQTV